MSLQGTVARVQLVERREDGRVFVELEPMIEWLFANGAIDHARTLACLIEHRGCPV